jgi:hypothetical protein
VGKKSRIPIPARVEEEALFLSDHTCCICRIRGKDVQLHHIDGNHVHNSPDNLIVLCLDCHSLVSGTRGLGKSYRPGEVRRYKRSWELQVQDRRKVHRPSVRYERELISQIDLIVCEILALDPRSTRVAMLFKLLYEVYLWRGSKEIARKLLDGMGHLAIMAGLSDDRKGKYIPEFLWKMCWHFVGPSDVPRGRQDVRHVKRCFDIMETLAKFTCEFGRGKETIVKITANTENLFEIALWYSKRDLAKRAIRVYQKATQACRAESPLFKYGLRCIRDSSRRLEEMLREQKPNWRNLSFILASVASE